jgi:hypothetical protein
MVIGTLTRCCVCGHPIQSCVLPAYCFGCDPRYANLRAAVAAKEESARLNAKPAAEGEGGEDGVQAADG